MNAVVPAAAPRRRRYWALGYWIAFALVLAVVLIAAAAAASWVADGGTLMPIHVVIDGDETWTLDPAAWSALHPVAVVVGLLVAFLVVVVVVPAALMIGFVALAIGLVVGLGVPLLVLVLVAGLVLSPAILLVAFAVWLVRKATEPARPPAANITP